MQIDWWTFALQAVNFVVLIWLLQRFLYRPVKDVIEKRKALAEQAFADADHKKREAEAERQRFESERAGLAQERQDMLNKIHGEMETERGKVLDEAKQTANALMDAAHQSVAEERESALRDLRDQAASLAVELASTLLKNAGSNVSGDAFLDQLEQQLTGMPDDERKRLDAELSVDGARLTVVTATPLPPNAQARWAGRLDACLGQKDKIDFTTDPEILGGVELHFPHAVLKLTWADQLSKAKDHLRRHDIAP